MSPKKIAFFALVAVVIVALGIGFTLLAGKSGKTSGPKGPKELTVWVVGDDTVGFDPLIAEFKKKDTYKDTNVIFSKFANYQDYERALINVIADGNSPDIFVIPSTGSEMLANKIQPISDSFFDASDVSKNMNRLFDSLVEFQPGKSPEGKDIQVTTLKWAPLGYETMGVYYNRAVLESAIPTTWEEFDTTLKNAGQLPVALGMGGRYIHQAPSIASLFLIQNGIEGVDKFGDAAASKALETYMSYAQASNQPIGLGELKPDMDLRWISATDLFVRGKVSVLFGYPSILREVEYALKRASSDAALEKRDLRSAPVPQSAVGKKTNIARYTYFAVSKYSSFPEAASDFVGFLTTKMAGELYSNSFPQYLPARNDVAEGVKDKRMNASFPWVRYESFIAPNDVRLINFDRSLTSEYEAALSRALDQPNLDAKGILDQVKAQVECRKKQLIERSGFDTSCES